MIKLVPPPSSGLPHSVCKGADLFSDGVRPLPGGQELAGGCRDQNQDMVSSLELPWLGRPIIVSLLDLLRLDEVLLDDRHHSVDLLPHLPHVLFPGLSGNVEQTMGLAAEEKLKRCEAGGGLRVWLNCSNSIWDGMPTDYTAGRVPGRWLW